MLLTGTGELHFSASFLNKHSTVWIFSYNKLLKSIKNLQCSTEIIYVTSTDKAGWKHWRKATNERINSDPQMTLGSGKPQWHTHNLSQALVECDLCQAAVS